MKSFKTLNIKQVSTIHPPPLYNYTIHTVSNPACTLHCTCTSTIQHNEPLMYSETLVLLQDGSLLGLRPAEYGFGRGLGQTGFVLGLGLVMLILVWFE